MAEPLEFYFDFSSPYSYLAAHSVDALGAEFDRKVIWRPFLLGAVFKVTGGKPLIDIPLKSRYMEIDLPRTARFLGLPFNHPSPFPFSAVAPSRAVIWAAETHGPETARDLSLAFFDQAFGAGQDIASPDRVIAIAGTLGLDTAAVTAALADQRIKDRLRAEVEHAIARDIFGAPLIIADGEPFWGHDRFDQLRWRLGGGR